MILHSKTALVDGVWAAAGAPNLDWRRVLRNRELNAVMPGVEFASRFEAAFDEDLAASDPVVRERWERRRLRLRVRIASSADFTA